ncbi:MAG: PHP-associated domain-containing protein [Candidatus Thorarchaeota archaeon]
MQKEGIETVTVGSDAHTPEDVGKGINHALEMLSRMGFRGPSTFRKRRATISD